MNFKEWLELKETMTSTSAIAGFSRMSIPLVRRITPGEFSMDHGQDEFFNKKKKKNKKHLSID